jgi:hypothetical protein
MDSAHDTPLLRWVAPFGDPRITACSRLPKAYRSVPRPSSPLGAKASTRCPCFPRPPTATTTSAPHQACGLAGTPPVGAQRRRREEEYVAVAAGSKSSVNCKPQVLADRSPERTIDKHTHAKRASCRRRKREGRIARLAGARRTRRMTESLPPCPRRRAPRHHLTMSKEHAPGRPGRAGGGSGRGTFVSGGRATARATTARLPRGGSKAWWAWADLNGRPHAYQACALTS